MGSQVVEREGAIGNALLSTSEEDLLAEYLKEHYLDRVNLNSSGVSVRNNLYSRYIKRLLDIGISAAALVVFLPVNLVLGVCTFFDVGRPVFYKQTRLGKDGREFIIVKFRNMKNLLDEDGKLLPPSQRVTKFGRFVRKYSLDELLNFWSVLKGDMSIIGPRPLPVVFTERMSERHKMRSCVRPGLECPRMEPGDPKQCQYQNQFENDVWYVEHISFLTDVKMLLKLFQMTFSVKQRSGAAQGAGYFAGYDENGIATTLKRFKRMYPEQWAEISKEALANQNQEAALNAN